MDLDPAPGSVIGELGDAGLGTSPLSPLLIQHLTVYQVTA